MSHDPDFESLLETEPRAEGVSDPTALSSAADRIKDLERVLATVRGFASALQSTLPKPVPPHLVTTQGYAASIVKLVNETLDPCKPWCVLEPGHNGACCEGCEDHL